MTLLWIWWTMLWLLAEMAWTQATQLQARTKRTIIGYYPLCPRGCASCSAINGCVTCRKGLYLFLRRDGIRQTGVCVHACPSGYYGTRRRDFSKCHKCSISDCEACFSRSYCTRCTAPYLAYRGDCVESCPVGLYYAQYSKECMTEVDCAVTPWSVWGPCVRSGQTCGYKYGIDTRTREIMQLPSPNGQQCPATTQSRRCRMKYRSCVDLLHNNSDPSDHSSSLWRKRRRRKWRNKWKRKDKGRNKDNRRERKKNKRRRSRNRKRRLRPLLPDVTTNQINSLLTI